MSRVSDIVPTVFTERVRAEVKRLQESGLTKVEIARRANSSRSSLARYESGGAPRTPEDLADLADAFGCTMDWLWGRVDDRHGFYSPPAPDMAEKVAAIADAAQQLREALQRDGRVPPT